MRADNPNRDNVSTISVVCSPEMVTRGQTLEVRIRVLDSAAFPESVLPYRLVSEQGREVAVRIPKKRIRDDETEYVDSVEINDSFVEGCHYVVVELPPDGAFYSEPFYVVGASFPEAVSLLADGLQHRIAASEALSNRRVDLATEYLGKAANDYERARLHDLAAETYRDLAALLVRQGVARRAQDTLRRALAAYREAGDARGAADCLSEIKSMQSSSPDAVSVARCRQLLPRTKVFVVVPTYNEEAHIGYLLDEVEKALSEAAVPYRTIVVDDGSEDHTPDIVKQRAAYMPIFLKQHKVRLGRSRTIYDGLSEALRSALSEDVVITAEVGGGDPRQFVPVFLERIAQGKDLIIGSRYQEEATISGVRVLRRMLSYSRSSVLKILLALPGVRDYGSVYRAYRARLLKETVTDWRQMPSDLDASLNILMEVSKARCSARGSVIDEVPLQFSYGSERRPFKDRDNWRSVKDFLWFAFRRRYLWYRLRRIPRSLAER